MSRRETEQTPGSSMPDAWQYTCKCQEAKNKRVAPTGHCLMACGTEAAHSTKLLNGWEAKTVGGRLF